MSKTVSFNTLGCRLNIAESGALKQGFIDRGYRPVEFGQKADVTFLNTCTVTDGADSTCRNLIRKAHRYSPSGTLVVAGCYSQMNPDAIAKMQGVDLVLGTHEKQNVFDYLEEYENQLVRVDSTNEFWGAATTIGDDHTRAFLKIQDGCNYICSFCIIPQARGRSRAISIEKAIFEAKKLVDQGFKEIVLTGVNIGEYEANSGEKLKDLLEGILQIPGVLRLRLSSVEANTITEELLETVSKYPNFLDHFHIPLQSGDDEILKKMRRKYTVDEYKKIIFLIKKYFPMAAIGADIIAGHPGEAPENFENTYRLLEELPITHFHVFPFSRRKGTISNNLPDQIPFHVKKERVKRLNVLGEKKLSEFCQHQVGCDAEVLFEKQNNEGFYEGYTENFVRFKIKTDQVLKNCIRKVAIKEAFSEFVSGSL